MVLVMLSGLKSRGEGLGQFLGMRIRRALDTCGGRVVPAHVIFIAILSRSGARRDLLAVRKEKGIPSGPAQEAFFLRRVCRKSSSVSSKGSSEHRWGYCANRDVRE